VYKCSKVTIASGRDSFMEGELIDIQSMTVLCVLELLVINSNLKPKFHIKSTVYFELDKHINDTGSCQGWTLIKEWKVHLQ